MTIPWKTWRTYIDALRKVNDEAAGRVLSYMSSHEIYTQEQVDDLIRYCYGLATKYGEAAAELAAQMYDALAAATGATVATAAPAATATMHEVAQSVVGTLKTGNSEIVSSSVGRLVKMAGVDTMMQNALRDGAEWAWIPVGETCAFCITLASQGWQRASRKAIKGGHAEHIHANCDCTYAIRFDNSEVEGYDNGRAYKELYYDDRLLTEWNTPDGKPPAGDEDAEKPTPKNRINAIRRLAYREGMSE